MKFLMTAAIAFTLVFGAGAAGADEVMTKSNGTALKTSPLAGAPTAWRVNSGFPLFVVDEQGDWLKVTSRQLPDDAQGLWVRADRVAPLGGEGTASAAVDRSEKPIAYRVELSGTPGLKFKLECRTVHDGIVSFRPHFNELPRTYEYPGDPIACVVWKKRHKGELRITLVEVYPTRERVIGSAATKDYPASIFARSRGPDEPTTIFPRSSRPWGPEAVVTATNDDLVLPPSAFAGP